MKTIIFSDLDGTLLDPDTYSFEKALPALRLIARKRIPFVFVSSKTRSEVEVWRKRLHNDHPFIVENGAGIYIPDGYFPGTVQVHSDHDYLFVSFGKTYGTIRKQFIELRDRLGTNVCGFGDMTANEVATLTNLPLEEAAAAKNREFSEPFFFPERLDERFLKAIE
jgi:mannosyl-3-phosphoglycerate phosphatase